MLKAAYTRGAREAFAKFGLAQPSLASVGIKPPTKAPGLPTPGGAPRTSFSAIKPPGMSSNAPTNPVSSLGQQAAKVAANVGMAASTPRHEGPGAVRGEPADVGRRTRSVIDRAFQRNEDDFATSSMPLPGARIVP